MTTKVALRAAARGLLPPRLESAILERPKLAAPAAFERGARILERYLSRLQPANHGDGPHPLRPFFNRALERYLLDLFVLLFVGRGGRAPEGFRARDLYRAHGDELREALRTASPPERGGSLRPRGRGSDGS